MRSLQTEIFVQYLLPLIAVRYCHPFKVGCQDERNHISRQTRGIRNTSNRIFLYPSASMHLSAVNAQVLRLSANQRLPITREETTILREILPTWEIPGILIPYPERVLVVQTLRRCTQLIPEGRNRLPRLVSILRDGGACIGNLTRCAR